MEKAKMEGLLLMLKGALTAEGEVGLMMNVSVMNGPFSKSWLNLTKKKYHPQGWRFFWFIW